MLSDANARKTRDTWYQLAQSHLQLAEAQYQARGYDFAIFHAYHAYECALCALIASEHWEVPPHGGTRIDGTDYYQGPLSQPVSRGEHDARAKFAARLLAPTKPYYDVYVRLDSKRRWRNESLYVEDDKLPSDRFTEKNAEWCLKNVRRLMQGLWTDIQNKPPNPSPPAGPPTRP
jgi:HEPN domain-containing protein